VIGVVVRDAEVVIVRRGGEPERGRLALPGGFLEFGEAAVDGCRREVLEETGLETRSRGFVGVYDAPDRSPTQTVSLAFLLEPSGGMLQPGDDADEAIWLPIADVPSLAFDHSRIIADARALLAGALPRPPSSNAG
jgi:8-oxo-dGTP diphosphatase